MSDPAADPADVVGVLLESLAAGDPLVSCSACGRRSVLSRRLDVAYHLDQTPNRWCMWVNHGDPRPFA
ncbi:hypothetical protein A5788_04585 [Gordonia sp. 852002-50816_SCH5313054-c]|uniref:hypothetical protein n=1 Tax=unclassified Gordonia (in: high G+C Gram-positive bacteria) TaxID=2657482 RepID=UPI0007EBDA35|nr:MULTISPECIES: hypothetical protein [unclassified Gordonia (in: high G+C Gram-positive bacteria)]OBC05886.1 hypothetical protein A5786_10790 [Gordonia sp. 852002-50816_SCH5313054-a]OBC21139.1 hypothetical protein A5788_04585 [Gordonia sp. 852002-50816_SCH5313054-c]